MRVCVHHIVTCLVLLAGAGSAEMQTWTSAKGQAIEGEFVRLLGSSVMIKCANGSTVSCQLASLNEESREQAKQLAEAAKAAPAKNGAAQAKPGGLSLSSMKASGAPTEAEISAFLTEFKETPTAEETIEFYANFSVPTLTPDQLKEVTKKKKIPYRVTMELCKTKMVDGKKKSLRMDGTGTVLILNEAGDVVDRQRESLGKLCPS